MLASSSSKWWDQLYTCTEAGWSTLASAPLSLHTYLLTYIHSWRNWLASFCWLHDLAGFDAICTGHVARTSP